VTATHTAPANKRGRKIAVRPTAERDQRAHGKGAPEGDDSTRPRVFTRAKAPLATDATPTLTTTARINPVGAKIVARPTSTKTIPRGR
jgi:hypothetical protein